MNILSNYIVTLYYMLCLTFCSESFQLSANRFMINDSIRYIYNFESISHAQSLLNFYLDNKSRFQSVMKSRSSDISGNKQIVQYFSDIMQDNIYDLSVEEIELHISEIIKYILDDNLDNNLNIYECIKADIANDSQDNNQSIACQIIQSALQEYNMFEYCNIMTNKYLIKLISLIRKEYKDNDDERLLGEIILSCMNCATVQQRKDVMSEVKHSIRHHINMLCNEIIHSPFLRLLDRCNIHHLNTSQLGNQLISLYCMAMRNIRLSIIKMEIVYLIKKSFIYKRIDDYDKLIVNDITTLDTDAYNRFRRIMDITRKILNDNSIVDGVISIGINYEIFNIIERCFFTAIDSYNNAVGVSFFVNNVMYSFKFDHKYLNIPVKCYASLYKGVFITNQIFDYIKLLQYIDGSCQSVECVSRYIISKIVCDRNWNGYKYYINKIGTIALIVSSVRRPNVMCVIHQNGSKDFKFCLDLKQCSDKKTIYSYINTYEGNICLSYEDYKVTFERDINKNEIEQSVILNYLESENFVYNLRKDDVRYDLSHQNMSYVYNSHIQDDYDFNCFYCSFGSFILILIFFIYYYYYYYI